ncbi:MAG: PAS domain-containing protein, partial [Chloroflexota bacterium]
MDQPGPQDPRVYLDAFNQLPMGVILLDASGRIVLANPQAGRLLNLDAEALRWRSINDLLDRAVHPGGWPFLPGEFPLAAAVAGGQTQPDMELGIYDPSTRTHTWVTATLSPLPTAPGQPDALFMLSLADSTALRSAEQRLNETQQWLALAVHSARIGLWEWNCQTNQSIISPEWKRQLGYRDDELPSAHNEWISSLHPDDRAQALAYLEAFIADPQPVYH